jgi:hypothetical protein
MVSRVSFMASRFGVRHARSGASNNDRVNDHLQSRPDRTGSLKKWSVDIHCRNNRRGRWNTGDTCVEVPRSKPRAPEQLPREHRNTGTPEPIRATNACIRPADDVPSLFLDGKKCPTAVDSAASGACTRARRRAPGPSLRRPTTCA